MPYVHIGVMVPDIDAAVGDFARLGLTFMEPRTVHIDRMVENGNETEFDLRVAFSQQGPPQLELLEVVGEGVYGPQQVGALHHIAVLDDDPIARSEQLVADGFRVTGAQYRPDGSAIVVYLESEALHGLRLELLHAPVNDAIAAWIDGSDATP
jgi:catechol 2,3-dioxygenase-like lactoylglutathione lyase family enzyme